MPQNAYAGFWKRFVAYVIDSVLLGFVSFLLFLPAIGLTGLGAAMNSEDIGDGSPALGILAAGTVGLTLVLIMVGGWLYFALMESSARGGTLGKMALGLRVTDMSGNRISFGRATGRYFAKIISGAIMGLGYIMAGFTQQKQALHDIIAGCLVVARQE
jgi:uncharacterized RDD family membrane protein YckC